MWRTSQGFVITNSLTELAAVSILITYLTEVRKEKLINASATVNILEFISGILSLPASILKDYLGCQAMVFLASLVYFMGMVLLSVSAFLRNSHSTPGYMFENLLLYGGLCLIALGKAGSNSSCVEDFFGEQLKKNVSNNDIDKKRNRARQMFWMRASQLFGVFLGAILIAKDYDWKIRYMVCAISMLLALGVFLIGSGFKCLEKAATTTGTPHPLPNDVDEQERENLHRNDEATETKKTLLLLVPISGTFLIYGIVKSIGRTFFLEQGNNMKDNQNSGILIPPTTILIIVSSFSKTSLRICINRLLRNRLTGVRNICAMLIIIGVGLIFSVICCATAQAVEAKRLGIIVKYKLQDITGDKEGDPVVPMSVFWLLPQFIFYGAMKGLVGDGMKNFFESELPICMRRYASEVTDAVTGIGTLISVGLVSIAAKASTPSWFANNVNKSHLDRVYRSLTIMCMIFCFVYAYVSTTYIRKRLPGNEEDSEEIDQPELNLEMTAI